MKIHLIDGEIAPLFLTQAGGGFNLQGAFENFLASFGNMLPGALGKTIGALLILFIGWIIASAIRKLVAKLLGKTQLDNKLLGNSDIKAEALFAKLAYFLIMIIVLMVVLEHLGISNVLTPLKNMVNEFLGFIPNIVGAGIVGFVGYILATIVSELVSVGGSVVDNFSSKAGMPSSDSITNVLKKLVFIIIFVPILLIALDILNFRMISDPAKEMLGSFMDAIPKILSAVVIIGVFYFVGRFITSFLKDLLISMKVDSYSAKLGLTDILGSQSLSGLITNVLFAFLMFMGIIAGVEMLEIGQLSEILNTMFVMSGKIAFGLIILALGNWISTVAADAISKTNDGKTLAPIVRWGLMSLFLAMGLSNMGLASNIINLAFGLILGAVAVAVALSYGLGGREAAGKHMEEILRRFRRN